MGRNCYASMKRELAGFALIASLSAIAAAQANDASLTGTYTWLLGAPSVFTIQLNINAQQVGFCTKGVVKIPTGYSCINVLSEQVLTGTLVSDGAGNITSPSDFVLTDDPNVYQCSTEFNPVATCPYLVPSGNPWNSTATYVVGDVVDQVVGGKTLTYQAVKGNSNVPPNTSACIGNQRPPTCNWDQLFQSSTGSNHSTSGSVSGTYAVQSNGAAVLQLTLTSTLGSSSANLAAVVPAKSIVGQQVPLVVMPQLNADSKGSGAAVRIK
jgi:hypothetical protein